MLYYRCCTVDKPASFPCCPTQAGVAQEAWEPKSRASRTRSRGATSETNGTSTRVWGCHWTTPTRTTGGTRATTLWLAWRHGRKVWKIEWLCVSLTVRIIMVKMLKGSNVLLSVNRDAPEAPPAEWHPTTNPTDDTQTVSPFLFLKKRSPDQN